MPRLILVLVVLAAVVYLCRAVLKKYQRPPPARPAGSEQLHACAQCRVHIPHSQAVEYQGQFFCCPQHQQDWQRAHPDD